MGRGRGGVALIALACVGLYLYASFGMGAGVDVLRFSSGVFDMDSARVVADWTDLKSRRISVHPLYKIMMAPPARGIMALMPEASE